MARHTDKSPTEYLIQRVEYYKKQKKMFIKHKRNGSLSYRFSDDQIDLAIKRSNSRIMEFEHAYDVLAYDKQVHQY